MERPTNAPDETKEGGYVARFWCENCYGQARSGCWNGGYYYLRVRDVRKDDPSERVMVFGSEADAFEAADAHFEKLSGGRRGRSFLDYDVVEYEGVASA